MLLGPAPTISNMFREAVLIISAIWWQVSVSNADTLPYTIAENQPPHTVIANITHDAKLDKKYTADVIQRLRFTFSDVPESVKDLFSIDVRSGILRTAVKIDRDVICASEASCVKQLAIQVQPISYFEIIKVSVTITDLNDNAPVFVKDKVSLSLTEASVHGTMLSLPTAIDPDSPEFGVKEYKLEPNSDVFSLKVMHGRVVYLELRTKLDREKNDYYLLNLIAFDTADPPNSGSVAVEVHVTDVNDNNPMFEKDTYNISIFENITQSSKIALVKASDPDLGLNGEVQFAFDPETRAAYGDLFEISNNGDIYVIGTLDHETKSVHSLTVMARDLGTNSIPVMAKVIVNVLDLNDNAPAIKINTDLTRNGQVQVSEFAEAGTFVAHLTVRDPDSGSGGAFECSLNDTHFKLQTLTSTDFKLVTGSQLDREMKSYYDLRFSCSDKGVPPQSSSKTFAVNIVDENDNRPVFAESSYKSIVQEDAPLGTFVVQVRATDADEGANAAIVYSLEAKMHGYLFIDAVSGNITTLMKFDYERTKRIEFLVTAANQYKTEFNMTTTVIIDILDADDEKPTFTETSYRFKLMENAPINTTIGHVSASDADSGLYNWFEFSIPSPQENAHLFQVNCSTGEVFTRENFDRECVAAYEVQVMARGLAPRYLSSTVLVVVEILDENDNAPVIDYPNVYNDTIAVSSQTPVGHVIAQVLSHDNDSGDNARLTYTFSPGSGKGYFAIGQDTGLVTIAREVKDIKYERFELGFHVRDNGHMTKTASMTFFITVDKSLVFAAVSADSGVIVRNNLTIVIVIASVSGLMALVLIVAILVFIHRQKTAKDMSDDSDKGMTLSTKSLVGRNYDQAPPGYSRQNLEGYPNTEMGYGGKTGSTNYGLHRNNTLNNSNADFSNVQVG